MGHQRHIPECVCCSSYTLITRQCQCQFFKFYHANCHERCWNGINALPSDSGSMFVSAEAAVDPTSVQKIFKASSIFNTTQYDSVVYCSLLYRKPKLKSSIINLRSLFLWIWYVAWVFCRFRSLPGNWHSIMHQWSIWWCASAKSDWIRCPRINTYFYLDPDPHFAPPDFRRSCTKAPLSFYRQEEESYWLGILSS
jgi:hypothetical protein